jgi:hypothetical protein
LIFLFKYFQPQPPSSPPPQFYSNLPHDPQPALDNTHAPCPNGVNSAADAALEEEVEAGITRADGVVVEEDEEEEGEDTKDVEEAQREIETRKEKNQSGRRRRIFWIWEST